jgi:hypothetical protein
MSGDTAITLVGNLTADPELSTIDLLEQSSSPFGDPYLHIESG